jgi:hypothetical protein
MKRLVAVSLIMAGMVLMAGFSTSTHAQTPTNDLKPTFISPTPGLYVNGWPAFTVSYPKDWEEMLGGPFAVFYAGRTRPDLPPGTHLPSVIIIVVPSVLPLEDWPKIFMSMIVATYTDIKVLSDKPSQLKDGTPSRETVGEGVTKDGRKENSFSVMTKKDVTWVDVTVTDDKGMISEDLKRTARSLTFLQGREEPVNVPPDVRAFFDMWCTDVVSHDLKAVMAHFSDRFRHSGASKAYLEQSWRNYPLSPVRQSLTSCETTVTVFEARGDKAYVDGFTLNVDKVKGETTATKIPILFQQIINEHGEWKWFGNQK